MNIGSWRIRNLTTFTKENGNSEKEKAFTHMLNVVSHP